MKKNFHPKLIPCKITCACGAEFNTFSILSEIHTEVCSKCHPFYTGKQKFLDTTGRVERFQARAEKTIKHQQKLKH